MWSERDNIERLDLAFLEFFSRFLSEFLYNLRLIFLLFVYQIKKLIRFLRFLELGGWWAQGAGARLFHQNGWARDKLLSLFVGCIRFPLRVLKIRPVPKIRQINPPNPPEVRLRHRKLFGNLRDRNRSWRFARIFDSRVEIFAAWRDSVLMHFLQEWLNFLNFYIWSDSQD